MNRYSLNRRLNIALIAFAIIACSIYTLLVTSFLNYHNENVISRTERMLSSLILQREDDLANQIFANHTRALRSTAADLQETDGVYSVTIYNQDGIALIHTRPGLPAPLSTDERLALKGSEVVSSGEVDGTPLLFLTSALTVIGELQGFVTITYDLSPLHRESYILMGLFAGLLAATVLAAAVICNHIFKRHLRTPLANLRDVMNRARAGELHHRAAAESTDELGQLVEAFNAMAASLQRNESSLRHAQTIYKDIFENAVEGIFQISSRGFLINANPALARLLGYNSAMELLAERGTRPLDYLVNQKDLLRLTALLRYKGEVSDFETRLFDKRGGILWVSVSARTIEEPGTKESSTPRYEGSIKDITEHRRLRELEQTRAAMIEADKAKSEFLAHMSHEIRTPMNSILGMAEQMQRTPLTPEQKECMNILQSSGESLLRLINDILDLTRVEGGQLKLDKAPFNLHNVVYHVRDMLAVQARNKNLLFAATIAPGVRINHMGDAQRLQQVLVNLAGNAIKFTHSGEVLLHVAPAPDANHDGNLLFTVKDTGIGVDTAAQARLFQKFSQASTGIHSKYGGSGLGLAISKHLVELMGGTIQLESELGVGTTVSFSASFAQLPAEFESLEQQPATTPSESPRLQDITILLAEDTPGNRAVVRMMLRDVQCTLVEAEDGRQALERFAEQPFDIVLMDINMPNMDGMEATQAIRLRERETGGHTPVVALTANAFQQDIQKYRQAGCDGYLVKPVTRKALLETLHKYTAGSDAKTPNA
ncbi:ATP-binding protein [Oleidesulfovibrio sp.]|uniref:hybrid sensor histidine kinase/response regulator n=1 Tax=Oleidesulfovibrio sp. TaxID=2909707 RepID=UPI003A874A10